MLSQCTYEGFLYDLPSHHLAYISSTFEGNSAIYKVVTIMVDRWQKKLPTFQSKPDIPVVLLHIYYVLQLLFSASHNISFS